jgi:hypothetical protein
MNGRVGGSETTIDGAVEGSTEGFASSLLKLLACVFAYATCERLLRGYHVLRL